MKYRWILAICVMIVGPLRIQAQWATDPTLNNLIAAAGDERPLQIARDGVGGAFILVSGNHLARLNAKGQILWQSAGFADPASPSAIRMMSDGAGGVLLTWTSLRPGNAVDIYAQRINASGGTEWESPGVILCKATHAKFNPALTSDGAGGALVVWEDNRVGSFLFFDLYAQHVNARGIVQWVTDGVPISVAGGSQQAPAIVADGAGGAIITWEDTRVGEQFDIYAQRVNASGEVQWTMNGVQITSEADNQREPTLVSDGAGGALITWRDLRTAPSWSIFAQHITANGAQQWGFNGLRLSGTSGFRLAPHIVSDGAGGALITWLFSPITDNSVLRTSWEIQAQRVNGNGIVQWASNGVSFGPANGQQTESPALLADGAGGAIVAWSSEQSGTGKDILAQRINANGTTQWTTNGVPVSTATGLQLRPRLVSDEAGGAIITWADYRSGAAAPAIYAQRIRSNGTLGGNLAPIAQAGPDQTVLVREKVQLDGSGSRDPDGDRLTYKWETVAKPPHSHAALSHPFVSNPDFLADVAGVYQFALTVNDGCVNSVADEVRITALAPLDATKALRRQVEALIAAGILNKNGNGLLAQLDAVIEKLSCKKTTPARHQLRAFTYHVKSLIKSGGLTPTQGQPLLDLANRIFAALSQEEWGNEDKRGNNDK